MLAYACGPEGPAHRGEGLKAPRFQTIHGPAWCAPAIYGREETPNRFVGAAGWPPATLGLAITVPVRNDATHDP
jgi:hypothetical protein